MKMIIYFTAVSILCLLNALSAHGEILKSKTLNGAQWVSIVNSEYGYFPFRTTEYYQLDTLDLNLEDKAGSKNLEEIKGICTSPKKEGPSKKSCYSEEVIGSKSIAKRICEVESFFSCP